MTYLFFDTETTGLPKNRSAPASRLSNWPRLVQIAWILCDHNGNEISCSEYLIRPCGFNIPKSSTQVHGITTAKAQKHGREITHVLSKFSKCLDKATTIVAHNLEFDEKVVTSEFIRHGLGRTPFKGKQKRCTMRASTAFCKIPGGPSGNKWPSLNELHYKLFRREHSDPHSAIEDVRACARCYFELKSRKLHKIRDTQERRSRKSILIVFTVLLRVVRTIVIFGFTILLSFAEIVAALLTFLVRLLK